MEGLRAAFALVCQLHLGQVFADHVLEEAVTAKQRFVPLNFLGKLAVFSGEFFDFQARQLLKLHRQDSAGLAGGQMMFRFAYPHDEGSRQQVS